MEAVEAVPNVITLIRGRHDPGARKQQATADIQVLCSFRDCSMHSRGRSCAPPCCMFCEWAAMQTLGSTRWPGCSRTKFGLPAQALTIPLDTAKVRLQIQGKVEGIPKYRQALPVAVE